MTNHNPNKNKEFAQTKDMANIVGFTEAWLKKNIGNLFFEGTHVHRNGHRSYAWDVPMVLNRIYNLNNEKAHREFMELRVQYLSSPKRAS